MTSSYDYIVIGSGSAGAVIAARLTEDPKVSVLLLEAGGRDRHPLQVMPLAFIKVAGGRFGTWRFETEPEPGLNNRRLEIKRGRTLGGSSSINAMIAIRGNATDYDLWRQQGLEGWSYADVLPYFRKLENSWRGDSAYHGAGGPVSISPTIYPDMLFDTHKQAARLSLSGDGAAEPDDQDRRADDAHPHRTRPRRRCRICARARSRTGARQSRGDRQRRLV
jgi:choline dehydrogenase